MLGQSVSWHGRSSGHGTNRIRIRSLLGGAWLAPPVEHLTLDPRVVISVPMLGTEPSLETERKESGTYCCRFHNILPMCPKKKLECHELHTLGAVTNKDSNTRNSLLSIILVWTRWSSWARECPCPSGGLCSFQSSPMVGW